jgi:tetratricopeptide (TPR) repeat protein
MTPSRCRPIAVVLNMQDNDNIDLWKLECEFAKNPKSLAFVQLANAYIGMGRFVEAMVVAMKGIKHHPELAAGRMILRMEIVPPPPDEPVKKPARSKLRRTIHLAAVLTVLLTGYLFYIYRAGKKQEKINDHVLKARALFAQDTFDGYTGALEHYKEILKLDDSHTDSLTRAAFSCAVLVGEHNADRKLIDQGKRFLARARTAEKKTSIASAAEGMLELYGGGGPFEAVRILEKAIKKHPRSLLVRTALGLAYLRMGDLFRAVGHLKRSAAEQDLRAMRLLARVAHFAHQS